MATLKLNSKLLWTVEDDPGSAVWEIDQSVNSINDLIAVKVTSINTGTGASLAISAVGNVLIQGLLGNSTTGAVMVGTGSFLTGSPGCFVGNSAGTEIAVNEISGYTGDLMNLQINGISLLRIDNTGTITNAIWEGSIIDIEHGGTGQVTANAALNNLLPSQIGNSGYYLQTNGTNTFWVNLTEVSSFNGRTGIVTSQSGDYTATQITYNNIVSVLTATNVQDAIDEVDHIVKLLTSIPNVIRVKNSNPGPGEYTSIATALASVSGATASNPYVVIVGPGVYTEPELIVSPYINIVGESILSTIIQPDTNNHHVFVLQSTTEISFLTINNAGAGYAGIAFIDQGSYGQAHKISFNNCDINILVTSATQDTYFYGEYIDFNGTYTYGLKVISSNGFVAYTNVENYYNFPITSLIPNTLPIGTYASGPNAEIHVLASGNNTLSVGNSPIGGTAFYGENGAWLDLASVDIEGWTYGIHIANSGVSSKLTTSGVSMASNIIYDLFIEDPNATGDFQGIVNETQISLPAGNKLSLSFFDTNGKLIISDSLKQEQPDGTLTDLSTLLAFGETMGLLAGGSISSSSGLIVSIQAGYGYITMTSTPSVHRYDWGIASLTLPDNSQNYIYFNQNGILSYGSSQPSNVNNILLGYVGTKNGVIEFISNSPVNATHTSNIYDNLFTNGFGAVYANGSIITENTTPFKLNITAGTYYLSTNILNPTGGTAITFQQYYNTGGSSFSRIAQTLVNNTQYNSSGTLVSLSTNYYAKHSVYTVGVGINEEYFVVLAQAQYSTLLAAQQALLPTPPSYFTNNIVLIGSIIVQQGASNIIQIISNRPILGSIPTGISASASHLNLIDLNTGNAGHNQFMMLNGSNGAMTSNLDLGNNNIVNVTDINSIPIGSFFKLNGNSYGTDAIIGLTDNYNFRIRTDNFDRIIISNSGIITIGNLSGSGTQVIGADNFGNLTVSVTTTNLIEGTNFYFTTSRVLATVLTGFVLGANATIVSTDTLLQAFEKTQGQINNLQPLNSNLAALSSIATTGLYVITGSGTSATVTITGTTNQIDISNGSGVGGNPTVSIDTHYTGQASITTLGTITTGVWNGTTIANTYLTNSTISGIALGSNLFNLTVDNSSLQLDSGTTYNGSAVHTIFVKSLGITNAMLAGSITANKLVGTDIATVGTITTGTWNATPITNAYLANSSVIIGSTSVSLGATVTTFAGMILTVPTINGGTHTAITSLGIRSTGTGTFDLTIANSENLTAGRTLTIAVNDAARTINLGGNITIAGNFITSGANSLTLTTTGITSVTLPTSGTLVNTAVTTLSSLVSVGTITVGTWNASVIGVLYGGTGQSSVTIIPTTTAWAGWDTNKNLSANNHIEGYTTTATTGGITTLVVGSTYQQFFTGTSVQTVVLPVTSTLVTGMQWLIVNMSTSSITVQSSGGNTIQTLGAGTSGIFTCTGTIHTTAVDWNTQYISDTVGTVISFGSGNLTPLFTTSVSNSTTAPVLSFVLSNASANTWFGNNIGLSGPPSYNSAGTLTGTNDSNITITLGGTPISSLLNSVSLTMGWTGQLSLTRGGTNANLAASNGGIVYSTSSALAILAGTATANQVLLSGASTTPTWSTATYPTITTINQILYSSATNTVAGLATANNGVLITSAGGVPSIGTTLPIVVQTNITELGTTTVGTWNASVINPTYGGTGVNNGSSTITLGGNLTTTGVFNTSFAQQGSFTITLPDGTSTLLANNLGITGGTTLVGDTASAGVLTLTSTSNITKGSIYFGSSSGLNYNQTSVLLGLGAPPLSGSKFTIAADGVNPTGATLNFGDALIITSQQSTGQIASTNLIECNSTAGGVGVFYRMARARGNVATPTVVASGDIIGTIQASGFDGTNFINTIAVAHLVEGTVTTGHVGSLITWSLASATVTRREIMRLSGTGTLSIGTTSETSLLTLGAGTATVAPLTLTSGTNLTSPTAGALEYDGTNLYFTPISTRLTFAFTNVTTLSSLVSVGTITTGVWNGTTITIANGGTGQTTATGAFNALSPLTTKGDILVYSTTNTRLPVGTNGQSLTPASGQTTGLQWVTNATTQSTPTNPTGTTSTTGVMMGISGSITPTKSGTILVIVSGVTDNSNNSDGCSIQIRTGTGTAPTNGAALTGTAQGSKLQAVNTSSGSSTLQVPFTCCAVVSGLTVGTAIWIDTSLAAITAGTATILNISISAIEI